MGHSIQFNDYHGSILTEEEISDFVEMFYRWTDSKFRLLTDEKEKSFRGQHQMGWDGVHNVTLCEKNISKDFQNKKRVGGNFPAPTIKIAAAMVLAHELQHANQEKLHRNENAFWGKTGGVTKNGNPKMKQYWGRACEREAREFVDNHMAEICAYFQTPWQGGRAPTINSYGDTNGEAQAVAELLMECSEVTMDDVKDELRSSKILNPKNVQFVVSFLKANGFKF